ncbi:DUF192 domain-containing protein [Patescibacteria group bacterium]|nr:DUF192 domain-containing protein [Patescibacteria group bacterium]
MFRKLFIVFSFVILLMGLSGCDLLTGPSDEKVIVKIETIKDAKEFVAEVADSAAEMEQGLMYRESLDDNQAMLFDLRKPSYASLWMKNTLIPLDMIFIDEDLNIVDIFKDVQPCATETCENYASEHKVRYLLEINGGLSDDYSINFGDKINISTLEGDSV